MRLPFVSFLLFLALAAPAAADSIVFIKDANVWVAAPDGSAARPLTTDGIPQLPYTSPSQSDDGTTVAVRGTRLYRIDRQGGKVALDSLLTGKPGSIIAFGPNDARISPDGTKIAYWIDIASTWYDYATNRNWIDPGSAIAIQSAVDGTPLGSTMFFEEPSWTADGRLLVFDSLNGGVPQVYSGAPGTNHNDLTPWFHDRDTHPSPTGSRPVGAGELSRQGTRLATLRGGGTSGQGYEHRMRFNHIQLYTVTDLTTPPTADCVIYDDGGTEFATPSWSPGGDALAWATPDGIYTSPVGPGCAGFAIKLILPGAREPDWGPADPGQSAAAPPPPPAPPAKPGKPKPPTVTFATRGRRVTVRCACAIKVVARKGKRVVGRGKGTGKVTVRVRARGKVELTVTAGTATITKTVRLR